MSYSVSAILLVGALFLAGSTFYLTQSSFSNENGLDLGFTQDFQSFLDTNGYSSFKFNRPDLPNVVYGGYNQRPELAATRYPIIFIHGNSDVGIGNGGKINWQTGFTQAVTYLTAQGWQKSDIYITTWGPANPMMASQNAHTKEFVMYVRKFIEAVLSYTKTEKVYIVGHSMGVTLARKAIQGGTATYNKVSYDVGPSLTSRVEIFFGLAGANLGLVDCKYAIAMATCNSESGFSPSPSTYLKNLNNGPKEANRVYAFWSPDDDIIKYKCMVNGQNTCQLVHQDAHKSYSGYTHFDVRDKTIVDILSYINQ